MDDATEFKAALREFLSNSELSGIDRQTITAVLRSTLLDMTPPAPSRLSPSDFPELTKLEQDVMSALRAAASEGVAFSFVLKEAASLIVQVAHANMGEAGARDIAEHILCETGPTP